MDGSAKRVMKIVTFPDPGVTSTEDLVHTAKVLDIPPLVSVDSMRTREHPLVIYRTHVFQGLSCWINLSGAQQPQWRVCRDTKSRHERDVVASVNAVNYLC